MQFMLHSPNAKLAKSYFEKLENIEIDISLKKLHTTATLEDAATSAKNRMALEPSADPTLVKDLIRTQVAHDTKKLNSEVGQLKKQITSLLAGTAGNPPKNGRRGQPGGASQSKLKKVTKRTPKKDTSSPTAPQGRAPKAGAPDSASSPKIRKKNRKQKQKKSGQRS